MKIDGFTYVRNGVKLGYPFVAAIKSVLPIVDRMIVVVGDSLDNTRTIIERINSNKIERIDSTWDENKRKSGEIFKEQSNIGIDFLKNE